MLYEIYLYPSQRDLLRGIVDTLDPSLRRAMTTAEIQAIYRKSPTIDPETLGYIATCKPSLIDALRDLERKEILASVHA